MRKQRAHSTNRRSRALALLLALALLTALVPAVSAPVAAESFYDEAYERLKQTGVVTGYPDGTFQGAADISRAEFVAMLNRAYGYTETGPTPFTDVPVNAWYAQDIGIAYTAGYFTGMPGNRAAPNEPVTREQALVLLAKSNRLDTATGEITAFADGRDFAGWSQGYVNAAASLGLIGGYSDGTYRPRNNISRGEMAVLLDRALGTLIRDPGTYSMGNVYGNLTISAPNTTLKDTTVAGNLTISGGLGLTGVELENVRVLGDIIVAGSGEAQAGDSVLLRNTQADALKVDSLTGQYLSLRADGDTIIDDVTVVTDAFINDRTASGMGLRNILLKSDMPGGLFTVAGNVESVVNASPISTLTVSSGSVQKLVMDELSAGSSLYMDTNGTVRDLYLDAPTDVTGKGDVDTLNVNTLGSTVESVPNNIEIRPGVTATIAGEEMNTAVGREASDSPMLLAGYPKVAKIAPTTATGIFAGNKAGTVYWGVSAVNDGSLNAEVLQNPKFSTAVISSGNVKATESGAEVTANITKLTQGGSFYLSAVLVDARGEVSPVKVISFSTPDNTTPAFANGYPKSTRITSNSAQYAFMTNKACDLYYVVLPKGSSAPTGEELRTGSVTGAYGYGLVPMLRNEPEVFVVNNLRELSEKGEYDMFVWLNDSDNSKSSKVTKVSFKTIDGTAPVFLSIPQPSNIANNSISFTTIVNEDCTVYMVASPADTDYPKVNRNNDLPAEWAISQIENGTNLVNNRHKASVKAKANQNAEIRINGLEAETEYNFFFLAKDAAGNYSQITITQEVRAGRTVFVIDEMVTYSTRDNLPPDAAQEFSHVLESDPSRPYPDTDVRIVFRENVMWSEAPVDAVYQSGRLLDLYRAASAEYASGAAKEAFRRALASTILIYDATTPAVPILLTGSDVGERTEDGQQSWVIDYRNATVKLDGGQLVVTFPGGKGLNLNSGSTYYFEIHDISDTSDTRNMMTPNPKALPKFTTVTAQVVLQELNETTIRPEYNAYDGSEVRIDAAFTVEPISTENVDASLDWDMIIWSDTTIDFELYRRPAAPRNTANNNKWEKLERNGSVVVNTYYAGTYVGQSLFQHLDAAATRDDNHPLRGMGSDKYEYAIHVTSLDNSTDWASWSKTVGLRVSVVSGTAPRLRGLARDLTDLAYESTLATGNVEQISAPSPFDLEAPFTDTKPPKFDESFPVVYPRDITATLTLKLDRPGTIYYVIAPAGTPNNNYAPTITTRDINGDPVTFPDSAIPFTENGTRVNSEAFQLTTPTPSNIYSPNYNNDAIKAGAVTVGIEAQDVEITGLTPETDYFIYFVLQGTGAIYSEYTELYKFTTTEVIRPKLELLLANPSVTIRSDTDALVDFVVLVYDNRMDSVVRNNFYLNALNPELKDEFDADYLGKSSGIADTNYEDLTVYEAMYISYDDGGSLFDYFAADAYKTQVANYIRTTQTNGANIIGHSPTGSPVRVGPDSFHVVNCAEEFPLSFITQYCFLAVGRSATGSGDAFRSTYPIQKVDNTPPQVQTLTHTLRVTYDKDDPDSSPHTLTGTITLTFNDELWYLDKTAGSGLRSSIQVDRGPMTDISPDPSDPTKTLSRDTTRFISIDNNDIVYRRSQTIAIATDPIRYNQVTRVIELTVSAATSGENIVITNVLCDEFSNVAPTNLEIAVRSVSRVVKDPLTGDEVIRYYPDVWITPAWQANDYQVVAVG
ncbi:MAG: S-layer homology domain-containing protein [Oscillospiraceae bacterium]|nr:S-layer homology domain-containing protein [Oscillospiraceae bacterium]